jgi:hypothetical protein
MPRPRGRKRRRIPLPPSGEWFSPNQVSRFLGVSRSTVMTIAVTKQLKVDPRGGTLWISRDSVERLLAEETTESTAA